MNAFIRYFRSLCLVLGILSGVACGSEINPKAQSVKHDCPKPIGYQFINGQILSMNAENSVYSRMVVENGRIVSLANDQLETVSLPCHTLVDLKGKTVIPGLIDSHVHYVRAGSVAGFDLRDAENTVSVNALLNLIQRQAATLPMDKPVTVIGGITAQQFAESRYPTLEELDAVVPHHLFYAQQGFAGPAFTNSKGRQYFTDKGVSVNEQGQIAAGKQTITAYNILKANQTQQDRVEGLQRLQRYANSLGITTVADQGGVPFPGAGFFNPSEDYQALLDLWLNKLLTVRVRAQRLSFDNTEEAGKVEEYLNNAWTQFGDDFLRITAMGEHIVSFPREGKVNPVYQSKIEKIAAKGWSHEQHSTSAAENNQHLAAIESIHALYPINDLRWSLAHVFELGHDSDLSAINSLKKMGIGLRVQNHGYSFPTDKFPLGRVLGGTNSGPLYRTLMDNGVRLGAGSDGSLLGPLNPWLSIYYMLTGKNSTGQLVNPEQTLSRIEALRLYTIDNAWFTFDEQTLGSLEIGKKADLVVLNKSYLAIPLEEIKSLRSVMTLVDGNIIYSDGSL